MAYFSNGTEGMMYEEKYCNKCYHQDKGCVVWMLHFAYNGVANMRKVLDSFIPTEDRIFQGECRMFVPISEIK